MEYLRETDHRVAVVTGASRTPRTACRSAQGTGPGPHGYETEPGSRSVVQGITGHLLNGVTERPSFHSTRGDQ